MTMRNPQQTIGNILSKQSSVYVSSIDEQGFPDTKALYSPRVREGIKVFYFTTNTSSNKVSQFLAQPKACVYFCDKRFYRGVVLKGHMEVLQDPRSKAMVWVDTDIRYYPEGVNDPDYCVLRFTASTGRYYSNYTSEDFVVE